MSLKDIFVDGHSEHLKSYVTESIPLIILIAWMMYDKI